MQRSCSWLYEAQQGCEQLWKHRVQAGERALSALCFTTQQVQQLDQNKGRWQERWYRNKEKESLA